MPEDAGEIAVDLFEARGFRVCPWFPEPTVCFCEEGEPCPPRGLLARIQVRFNPPGESE